MKNKYIQKEFGTCVHVCLANAFNKHGFIPKKVNPLKGMNWFETREFVEKNTEYTTQCLLFSPKPIKTYLPVFEVDNDFGLTEDLYSIFLVSVKNLDKNYNHCFLVIKKNFNDELFVLNPYFKPSVRVNMYNFFKIYDCSEIDSICSNKHGGTMFFNNISLEHLIR